MHLSLLNKSSIIALSLLFAGCKADGRIDRADQSQGSVNSELVSATQYPPARWRLVNQTDLDHVVLWVAQILIRHDQAPSSDPAFALADWHSRSPGGQRTRAEAFSLASEVRERAAKDPGQFAELVQRYSEDVATRPLGGSLGGITASQLILSGNVLDALAATPPGQISQVIETRYGFHILQRRPPPPEETVSGAHIVISHNDAGWIRILGRSEVPARSIDDALALATQLYEKAREKPEEFSKLVEQYSEHRDALRSGDMGTWSTREPTYYPREVEVLRGLQVGEIAPPLDSPVGFQIIRRTPNPPRERYAMAQVRLYFEPLRDAPDPSAQSLVLAKATELSLQLSKDPSRFDALQKEFCCTYPESWIDGRGAPALTTELSRLHMNQIAVEPIRSEFSYVIPKRIEPPASEPETTRYDLPDPSAPNILAFVWSRDDNFLREHLAGVGEEVATSLPMSESLAKQVAELHGGQERFTRLNTPELRTQAFNTFLNDIKGVLGPEKYERYWALLNAHFERALLRTY